ncbi:MAG: hypothetical protein ACFCUR_14655 [Rhodomicrobiaceae bacterium]
MSTHHSTPSDWVGNLDTSNWAARVGGYFRNLAESFKTGIEAANDYRTLSAQKSPQEASRIVFERHFNK